VHWNLFMSNYLMTTQLHRVFPYVGRLVIVIFIHFTVDIIKYNIMYNLI